MKTYLVMQADNLATIKTAIDRSKRVAAMFKDEDEKPLWHVKWDNILTEIRAYPLWTQRDKAKAIEECRQYNKRKDNKDLSERPYTYIYIEILNFL